jgi:hypothetical protein
MNTTNRLPNSGDEVDRLLSNYFQAEMPNKWSAPQPWATTTPSVERSHNQATRSRWALAASVAILVGGCWYLSTQITDGKANKGVDLGGGEANTKHVKDLGTTPPKTP